jgi:3-deoxy-D-manno-octulosonate 8-phosphate phosphatase (KDO 8-P phosphatase)
MKIKAIVMDVDGTLTDGGIYLDNNGNELKKFNVKDGYAISTILPQYGIEPIVITGRKSEIVRKRCEELNIKRVVQGSKDKAYDMKIILNELAISMEETVYIGDDINDIDCMKLVGACACPNDAVDEIKKICDIVAEKKGGYGAVREIIDKII